QRAAQDARGAAAARQVHLRDDRDPQGAGDGAVALPAVRPAARRGRGTGDASRRHRRQGRPDRRAGGAGADRTRGGRLGARRALATALSLRVLSRTWQMLFKGIPDVQSAAKPISAAEMVLVRIAYAADLPTPDELVRTLTDGESAAAPRRQGNGDGGGVTARLDAPRETPRDTPTGLRSVATRAAAAPQRQEPIARPGETAAPRAAPVTLARFADLIAPA